MGEVNPVNAPSLKSTYHVHWPKVPLPTVKPSSAITPPAVVEESDDSADPDRLFRQHASYVAGVAIRLLGRDVEVDDVVQDVFMAAVRGLGALRDPGAVQAWLTKVAVRTSMRRLRWRRLRRTLGLDGSHGYDDLPDPSLSAEDRHVVARIYVLLDGLAVADRVAWTLRCIDDRSATEVANLQRCSLATAKRRIARVEAAIRRELTHE
jgi:RNA polymerase sigma-70 factor (ECF subfamily)